MFTLTNYFWFKSLFLWRNSQYYLVNFLIFKVLMIKAFHTKQQATGFGTADQLMMLKFMDLYSIQCLISKYVKKTPGTFHQVTFVCYKMKWRRDRINYKYEWNGWQNAATAHELVQNSSRHFCYFNKWFLIKKFAFLKKTTLFCQVIQSLHDQSISYKTWSHREWYIAS